MSMDSEHGEDDLKLPAMDSEISRLLRSVSRLRWDDSAELPISAAEKRVLRRSDVERAGLSRRVGSGRLSRASRVGRECKSQRLPKCPVTGTTAASSKSLLTGVIRGR